MYFSQNVKHDKIFIKYAKKEFVLIIKDLTFLQPISLNVLAINGS